MTNDQIVAAGRAWAEREAESMGAACAITQGGRRWLASWRDALPLVGDEVSGDERRAEIAEAINRAAAERWESLYVEAMMSEGA